MAFPTTGILDTFTGADEDPITTNWTTPLRPSGSELRRVSNQLARETTGSTSWTAYYDIETFGPDSEAYIEVPTLPGAAQSLSLMARAQSPGVAGVDFYQCSYTVGTGWRMYRVINNAYTQLGVTDASPTIAAGDSIGFEVTGVGATVTLNAYKKTGGVWSLATTESDTNALRIVAAGYLGAEMTDTTVRGDNFGGGTVGLGSVALAWIRA